MVGGWWDGGWMVGWRVGGRCMDGWVVCVVIAVWWIMGEFIFIRNYSSLINHHVCASFK